MSRRQYLLVTAAVAALATAAAVAFARRASSDRAPPPPAPPGMVYVPGGTTHVGALDGTPDERPVTRVDVPPFFLDATPVTVAQFRAFVEATRYLTSAERFGDGAVLSERTGAWELRRGATWHHPLGPAGPAAPDDHPVTQVSWHDATAFAAWAGKRLPTELEWEHAARGARDDRGVHAWGAAHLDEGGHYRANVWQGRFPIQNSGADGHLLTSPVGAFGATALGLADLAGNVWEWTDSWYRSYAELGEPFRPGADSERVQRGGSFLCHEDYCHGYRVSARGHATPESSFFHVGFRLARDIYPSRLPQREQKAAAGSGRTPQVGQLTTLLR